MNDNFDKAKKKISYIQATLPSIIYWPCPKNDDIFLGVFLLIGTCIYNVVILSLLGVGLGMVLSEEVHLMAALNGVFTLLATFCTQLIIFLPKVGDN